MIYTCYEMIQDCRQSRPEGWSYFITHYVPVIRGLLAHYFPERAADPALLERVLLKLRAPDAGLFHSLDPAPERAFVAELRQRVLAAVEADRASATAPVAVELETLGAALEPLTMTEKLVAWFETMRYGDADAGRMLRMSAQTAEKIRVRAAELIRGAVDSWRSTILADNGVLLGQAAAALSTKDCPVPKAFFDVIDGRTTWRGREEMEQHVKNCWYCLDHYCRLLEVVDLLRAVKPLPASEAEDYKKLLGLPPAKRSVWSRA